MLAAHAVTVTLRGRPVLHEVSMCLSAGRMVAVIGPNGAGKSTLLRVLSGELRPVSGRVELAGKPLASVPLSELARRRAVLPQSCRLAFPLTCLEVVLLARIPHQDGEFGSRERPRDRSIALAALDEVGLSSQAEVPIDTLSGGQRQLVHFARARAQIWDGSGSEPRYLLLDEPTASLDLRYQHTVLEQAQRLARAGAAVLTVLHDINLAAQYADEVVLLAAGRVVSSGPPRETLRPELLSRAFGVSVRLWEVAGRLLITTAPSDLEPAPFPYPNER